jgi:hypothetical protein
MRVFAKRLKSKLLKGEEVDVKKIEKPKNLKQSFLNWEFEENFYN